MKRVKILLLLCASLLLSSCGAPAPARNASLLTVDQCVQKIDEAARQMWGDRYSLTVDGNTVSLSAWQDYVADGMSKALAGSETLKNSWNSMTADFVTLSTSVNDLFDKNGHTDIKSLVNILDDTDKTTILFQAQDGKPMYDPVNNIDYAGLNRASAEAAGSAFAGLIDGAEIEAHGSFQRNDIILKTTLSTDTQPDDWENLRNDFLAAALSSEQSKPIVARIEAENGDVLLSVVNEKIMYDVFALDDVLAIDEELVPGAIVSVSRGGSQTDTEEMVWISKSGKKYHSTSLCSNMDASRASRMSLSEALAKGYTRCSNCW